MDKTTSDALEASIAHWEEIAALRGEAIVSANINGDACALCDVFAGNIGCAGCPVSEKTQRPNCLGSPWIDVRDARYDVKYNSCSHKHLYKHAEALFISAAQAELDFLKALRPSGVPDHE